MNSRQEKKRRRFFRESFNEKINSDSNKALKLEIFRLARFRDILFIFVLVESAAIITLSILLFRHW